MRISWVVLCFTAILAVSAAANDAVSEIQNALHAQQDAWNRGDIEGFMEGYWRSPKTIFVSGDDVTRGWQKVLDRYKAKYSDRAKMGTLEFSDVEITSLDEDAAVALGSWRLKRATVLPLSDSSAIREPHGRFTLIFQKLPDGWKIIHDHTSAAPTR